MSKKKIKFLDIIEIEWIDTQSLDEGLISKEYLNNIKPVKACVCGYFIKETKESVIIAHEKWENEEFKYIHIIPKASILKIKG